LVKHVCNSSKLTNFGANFKNMLSNIPDSELKRVVIVGAGFGGLKLARHLSSKHFQVVLIDKNNFHSFQPLFYQVATAGIEPSAISFPLRKIFQGYKNIHVRMARVKKIFTETSEIETSIGNLTYDYLVLAQGAGNNFFGNASISMFSLPMKSVGESLGLRNTILNNFEKALNTTDPVVQDRLMNMVVVGGGPTGVEISGALAEMKNFVLPKDYPELDFSRMHIYLVENGSRLLGGMSERSSQKAGEYLEKLGVTVMLNSFVRDFDNDTVWIGKDQTLNTHTLIWAAGIKANSIEGFDESLFGRGNRIMVDHYNKVKGYENIFAIGDAALMLEKGYPNGHPQVAQVAIQQAKTLAGNLKSLENNQPLKKFQYRDLGTLATVGRNRAVVDLGFFRFQGLIAWFFWMFIHLMAIVGVKNRLIIFINWAYYYFTYDQSLRLIIKPKMREGIL
jgi:NADH:ubiquinone reductase (H+-translocating)